MFIQNSLVVLLCQNGLVHGKSHKHTKSPKYHKLPKVTEPKNWQYSTKVNADSMLTPETCQTVRKEAMAAYKKQFKNEAPRTRLNNPYSDIFPDGDVTSAMFIMGELVLDSDGCGEYIQRLARDFKVFESSLNTKIVLPERSKEGQIYLKIVNTISTRIENFDNCDGKDKVKKLHFHFGGSSEPPSGLYYG